MPISLGAGPQPDFNQPIDLMMDCHRRIERFLDLLLRVASECHGGELPDEHRRALETALNYFHQAAPRHTADEEDSLFPLLRQMNDPEINEALEAIDALEAEHDQAALRHEEIEALGRRWLAEGTLPPEDAKRMEALLVELTEMYSKHIAVEDTHIFPLAKRKLVAQAISQVGREMAHRRAVDPGRPESRCAQRRKALAQEVARE